MNLSFTLRSDEPRTISESRSIPHQIKLQTETAFFLCVRRGRSDLPDLTQTPGDSTWTFLFVLVIWCRTIAYGPDLVLSHHIAYMESFLLP
ncbi:unnamed protein product [Lathyrus oleraceus]